MIRLRQLLILLLMPIAAWSGLPQIGCRCSNGTVLRYCPMVSNAFVQKGMDCQETEATAELHSCCCDSSDSSETSDCCNVDSKPSSENGRQCTLKSCCCTPILLGGPIRISIDAIDVPDLDRSLDAFNLFESVHFVCYTSQSMVWTDTGPPSTADLIVLLGHRLI